MDSLKEVEDQEIEPLPRKRRPNWFEQMDGFLNWKVIPPDIHNPFKPPMADRILLELAYNPTALRAMTNLRCMCDGYEVLLIKNLETPLFRTDHPCISSLSRSDIMDFIDNSGLNEKINTELEKTKKIIIDEINAREAESEERGLGKRKLKKKDKKPKMPKANGGSTVRVIRA